MLASLGIAAVLLTNIPGTLGLAMALIAYTLSTQPDRWVPRGLAIASSAIFGYLLVAPLTPLSALRLMMANVQWMDPEARFAGYRLTLHVLLGLFLITLAYTTRRFRSEVRFSVLFTLLTAAITLGKAWFGVSLLAQPIRFHLVMEMAIALAIAMMAVPLVRRSKLLARSAIVLLTAGVVVQVGHYRSFARKTILRADIAGRSETKVARWMQSHANGARVMTPGSSAFWLNAFADTPQLTGCCDQNALLSVLPMVKWQLGTDSGAGSRAAEVSIAWLQTMGIRYVAVNGPRSTEVYKDILHPGKFDGVLHEAWRDGDDAIFEVPATGASLAVLVRPDESIHTRPENGLDIGPLEPYRRALTDPARPKPTFYWIDTDHGVITGTIPEGYRLSVRLPNHPGWNATVYGRPLPIESDALGFMQMAPNCGGLCEVLLQFDGGLEQKALTCVSILAWMSGLVVCWNGRHRRHSSRCSRTNASSFKCG